MTRRRLELPISLLAGVVTALSLPPFGFWVLAPFGAAALWWALAVMGPWRRLLAGWLFGVGCFGIGLWWVHDFNVYGAVALIVLEALTAGVAALVTPRGLGRTPLLAGAMVLMEWVRSSWPFGGLPLGGVALGQAASPAADAVRVGGPLLLVGMVWMAGGGTGLALTGVGRLAQRMARPRSGRHSRDIGGPPAIRGAALRALASGLGALAAVVGLGIWGSVAPDGGRAYAHVRVAAVQGGGRRGLSKAEVPPSTVFDAAVSATNTLISSPSGAGVSLIVWPEDVVGLDRPLAGSDAQSILAATAQQADATLLAGVTEPAGKGRFRNEIVAFDPSGTIIATYEKVHRVPFGEYVPWRGFFGHLADLSAVPEDAVAGRGSGVLRTGPAVVGAMVSYEVFFADRGRIPTRAGARLLIVPTNTSSYSTSQVPCQEVAASRLQALAEGRDLVQAAPTGFSALIDHDGHVLQRSHLGPQALLVGTVGLRSGHTIYERYGDAPVSAAAGVAVLVGWTLVTRRWLRRRRRAQS
ncbi:MAG: apolipoprotein N-acyltransferase [Acidimicrobiales bacterium]